MGLLEKMLTGGAVALAGVVATDLYRQAQETKRRKRSPLRFGEDLTQDEFIELARDVAKRTPRVEDVVVTGMTVTLYVGSISGLSTWTAEIDFNDYGRLTGTYWLQAENSDSLIPGHFGDALQAEVEKRVGRTGSERSHR